MKAHYSAEQKQQVLTYLANGLSVKEASGKTGVKPQTISNWKSEQKNANGGSAEPKKRIRKAKEPEKSAEEKFAEWALASQLDRLENNALRKLVNEPNPTKRMMIEIEYLRDRCKLWDDKLVRPLLDATADEDEEGKGDPQ